MPQLIFRPEPFEGYMEFDEWEGGPDYESDYEWEGEVSRTSPEYIRWVQQSLNQIMGLQLAVDDRHVVRRVLHVDEDPVEPRAGDHLDGKKAGEAVPEADLHLAGRECARRRGDQ